MELLAVLLYSNLIVGTINWLIFLEILYHIPKNFKCLKNLTNNQIIELGIIGEDLTVNKNFPYTAALLGREENEENYNLVCPVTIVSLYFTFTTAHCTDAIRTDFTDRKIRSASLFWNHGGFLHNIDLIIKHESFNQIFYENDFGLISVKTPFYCSQLVYVAGPSYKLEDNSPIVLTGWGETIANITDKLSPREELIEVSVHTINKIKCNKMLEEKMKITEAELFIKLHDSQYCAETVKGKSNACFFDSGVPAIQNNVLVGIISFGGDSICGSKMYPGVYVNISHLHNWIKDQLANYPTEIVYTNHPL